MAPPIYFDIRRRTPIELADVAEIQTGKECGSNGFFYRRKEDIEELGLEDYFLPLLKASGQVSRIEFDEKAAEEWGIFDIHDLVEKAFSDDRDFGDKKIEQVKEWLGENGHENALEYIQWGEDEGHHEKSAACRKRDVWLWLDDLDDYRPRSLFLTSFGRSRGLFGIKPQRSPIDNSTISSRIATLTRRF
ncbi:hypothetical protein ACFQE1_03550 [Halobium palmae]|uniref:Type II methyltransferase M.Eco57I C-terminal domain-containing protein n=1 Tax=Halobium palmae TaxID=1776492 RepID=A0ABD5RX12_9EURY